MKWIISSNGCDIYKYIICTYDAYKIIHIVWKMIFLIIKNYKIFCLENIHAIIIQQLLMLH